MLSSHWVVAHPHTHPSDHAQHMQVASLLAMTVCLRFCLSFDNNAITKKNKFFPGLGRKLRKYYIYIIKLNCSLGKKRVG